jgi:predicted esterase
VLEKTRLEPAGMPTIVAFHGDADPLVSLDDDRRGVRMLEKRGIHVDLRVYPGLGHALTAGLRDDLFAALARSLGR